MKRILFSLLVLSLSVQAQNKFVQDSLEVYIKREMARWQVPGMAVAIVKDGKVIVNKGYGVKKINGKDAVDQNTLFMIASNSKAFTGTSLALLAHQRKLSLDDKVTKWLPYFKMKDDYLTKEITVKDLLTHRIGFATFQSDFVNWASNMTRKELIENMRNVEGTLPFRAKYGYCNVGFLTAGEVIPAVCDTSWDDYLKYHFFQPLNMNRTSTTWKTIKADANAAIPHGMRLGNIVTMDYANVDNLGPAASINSCTTDLCNWMLMQLDSGKFNGKTILPWEVITATRTQEMAIQRRFNPYYASNHFNGYGLGWFLKDLEGKMVIEHTGGANGFVTTVCLVPELNLGIAVLTNSDYNDIFQSLRDQLVDGYLGRPYRDHSKMEFDQSSVYKNEEDNEIKKLQKAVLKTVKPEELNKYVGEFVNPIYGKVTIKNEKGLKMYFQRHPLLNAVLEPLGNEKFLATYNDVTYGIMVFPFQIENGKVTGVTVSVNGFIDYFPYEFKKVTN